MDTFNGNIDLHNKTIFLTGVAGFIGANLAVRLLADYPDIKLVGIDNMNDYYDVKLKEYRLEQLSSKPNFTFIKGSIADKELIQRGRPQYCVNLRSSVK